MLSFPRIILYAFLWCVPFSAVAQLQTVPALQNPSPDPATEAATKAKLTALRDAFVGEAKSSGPACTLSTPGIEITDVPSFGNYDPQTNTLRISAWGLLSADQKKLFFHLAGPNADDEAAHRVFDHGTYGWVFVHELGHWWQACMVTDVSAENPAPTFADALHHSYKKTK